MDTNTITRFRYDDDLSLRRKKSKSCNSQICFAYILSIIASIIIVGGVYLSYIRWDKMWLILSILGIILILFGSCLYYSGNVNLYHSNEEHFGDDRPRRRRRNRNRGFNADQLMPSAPPLSQSRTVSQFSLNMIPQYFSSNESENIQSSATNTPSVSQLKTFSQIFSVNGQSYLILPLSGEPLPASNSFPLQNLVVRVTEDNKVQNSINIETENEMSSGSEPKKINREEQSCQTDDFPKEIRKITNRYRDVQLQTISNTQLEQMANEVVNNPLESSPLSRRRDSMRTQTTNHLECNSVVEINSNAGPSHSQSNECQPFSIESYESSCSSANTESDNLNLDSEIANSLSLINFNDDNNACTSSAFNCTAINNLDVQTEQNSVEDYVESDHFNSFSNANMNEEDIDDNSSTPPPSYEEILEDDNSDETPIFVNYGTL